MSTYQLATLAQGVAGLQDLVTITGVDPQPSEFLEYSEAVAVSLTGKQIEAGFPTVTWTWDRLRQTEFDRLYSYCTGMTSPVYIRTRVNSGTGYNFGIFRAEMGRPKAKTAPGNMRTDVQVKFTMLRSPGT
jgi:hypothetical protein